MAHLHLSNEGIILSYSDSPRGHITRSAGTAGLYILPLSYSLSSESKKRHKTRVPKQKRKTPSNAVQNECASGMCRRGRLVGIVARVDIESVVRPLNMVVD